MKKPRFPKIIITLLLLLLTAGAFWLFAVQPSDEAFSQWFCDLGEFICRYDKVLIGILLAVNLAELIDILIFAKRDEVINVTFESATSKRISLLTAFKNYFAGIFTRGPFLFATEELGSAIPRLILHLVVVVVKFVSWLVLLIAIMGMGFRTELYEFAMNEGVDYSFTLLVLYACLNCSILVYALYRILPLHEARTYKVITYYTDGSSTRGYETKSNFIAILILTAFIYLFYSAYYILPASSRILRMIETGRLRSFLDREPDNNCLWDYYGTR